MTDPYQPLPESHVPQGYLPPADAYYQPLPTGFDPNDPLVNPPNSGISGWFSRIGAMFKRSWKTMLAIFAITHILPYLGLAAIGVAFAVALLDIPPFNGRPPVAGDDVGAQLMTAVAPLLLVIVIALIAFIVLQSAGYAAATYAATREAAGIPVRLGEALGYGFRRCLGLFGWQLVVGLLMLLGVIACFLPAIYVYAATALFGPIYLFERISPIGRSFSIFNNNLGRVLGRLALILVATIAVSIAGSIFDQIGALVAGASNETSALIVAAVISSLFGLALQLPLTMLTFSGILLTYTEQRGYEGANTGTLVGELR